MRQTHRSVPAAECGCRLPDTGVVKGRMRERSRTIAHADGIQIAMNRRCIGCRCQSCQRGCSTMAEYIDREAAVKSVLRMRRPENSVAQNRMLSIIQMDMLKLPAADVAPVVHGRWRYCGFLQECQSCGEIYSRHGGNAGKLWNFCPNCGAKMQEVE